MYLITIIRYNVYRTKVETHDLYLLDDKGTLTNETAQCFVSKNQTIDTIREFARYLGGEITEIVEI